MRGNAAALGTAAREGSMRKLSIVVLILVAIPVVWFQWTFPTVSYRYRLTVAVEVDGQVHSGSTVIGIWYRFNPRTVWHAVGVYNESVSGQAAVIDLGTRGVLVAALGGPDHCDVAAGDLLGRAYDATRRACVSGYPRTLENEQVLAQTKGSIELTSDNMPPFIWFADKNDPKSARFVKPGDFASIIGDATHLVAAEVQITQDPILIDINKELPLYKALPPPPAIILPGKFPVNWSMFIAPGSIR